MADTKRLLPYIGIGVLVLIVIVAVVVFAGGGGGFLTGSAGIQGQDCYWDPYLEEYVCDEESTPESTEEATQAPAGDVELTCSLFSPDVGDAAENGLIATDAPYPAVILIATDQAGNNVVAKIVDYYGGQDTFQVPEEYRSSTYWFKAEECGRWHSGQEFGFE